MSLEFFLHLLDQRVIQRRQGGFICPTFPISTFDSIGMGGLILKAPPLMWQDVQFDRSLHKKSFWRDCKSSSMTKKAMNGDTRLLWNIYHFISLWHIHVSLPSWAPIPKLARGEVVGVPCGYLYPFFDMSDRKYWRNNLCSTWLYSYSTSLNRRNFGAKEKKTRQ
jgi:hypothetical protein